MKQKTEDALETYINGNISDARKYFERNKAELLVVVAYFNDKLEPEKGLQFLRLMQRGHIDAVMSRIDMDTDRESCSCFFCGENELLQEDNEY